ncbi:MAG: AMP-dependent synthetase [Calditrichaeota bacterium]|nr:MAG: AMP-dependent synthetase [Calditrichota bacterium]
MLVHHFLEQSAARYPERPAAWFRNRWLDFAALNQGANRVAHFLLEQGIRRGDRVAMLWENSFHYIMAYYGILKAGAVTVELNTELLSEDLVYLLKDSGARGLLIQKKFARHLNVLLDQADSLEFVLLGEATSRPEKDGRVIWALWEEVQKQYPPENPAVRCIDLDLASIVYTSGSTGRPKGVMLSHLNIVTNTRSIVQYLHLNDQDRVMVILPFFYVYGKSLLNTHFYVGGSVVIDNRFTFPNAVLNTMKQTRCTGFAGVPSTFSILLHKSAVRKYRFPNLRYVTQAGGPMAPNLQKEVALTFYPASLYIMYGATEASARLSYLDPADLPRKWGSIGKAIPNVELFVADEEGRPLPPGQTGQIVARGANIMQGYWNDEEETRKVLRNGLYFTGDLGKMDEEGFLYVVGRAKDMIKVGANRISAKEVEEKLLEHPGVLEVAVIGVEDPILGEAIKAFVVAKPEADQLDEASILQFARDHLPPYKVPKYVVFLPELPKSAAGKILKTELAER